MLTIYVFNRICKKNEISDKNTFYSIGLFLFNPLYFMNGISAGHFDVVVGLCVLLAVYSIDESDQLKSGIYASLAFLFKFVGLVLLFPLIFTKRRVNWKLGIIAVAICGGAYLLGFILWGSIVFDPFLVHIFRNPEGSSIILFINKILGFNIIPFILPALIIGVIIISIYFYFKNNDISTYSLILVILFILILPVFWIQYCFWFFPLLIYWSINHKYKIRWLLIFSLAIFIIAVIFYYFPPFPSIPLYSVFTFLGALVIVLLIFLNRKKDENLLLRK
jgi:Gpi18-like mannosyltransferase